MKYKIEGTLNITITEIEEPILPAPVVPRKEEYWAAMEKWSGHLYDHMLKNNHPANDLGLANTYYDGALCSMRMYEHTKDIKYIDYAAEHNYAYVDHYVIPVNGASGYRNFTRGLWESYKRTHDIKLQQAAITLLEHAVYCATGEITNQELSREAAYALMAHMNVPKFGYTLSAAQKERRQYLFERSLDICDEWAGRKKAKYVRPFMCGITAEALIQYYEEESKDTRILPALTMVADYIWKMCWVGGPKAFNYTDRDAGNPDDLKPQPDLNMLIAPFFGWLYAQTKDTSWKEKGDEIFTGGIPVYSNDGFWTSGSYLGSVINPSGKQINQQLWAGPLYISRVEGV